MIGRIESVINYSIIWDPTSIFTGGFGIVTLCGQRSIKNTSNRKL